MSDALVLDAIDMAFLDVLQEAMTRELASPIVVERRITNGVNSASTFLDRFQLDKRRQKLSGLMITTQFPYSPVEQRLSSESLTTNIVDTPPIEPAAAPQVSMFVSNPTPSAGVSSYLCIMVALIMIFYLLRHAGSFLKRSANDFVQLKERPPTATADAKSFHYDVL